MGKGEGAGGGAGGLLRGNEMGFGACQVDEA